MNKWYEWARRVFSLDERNIIYSYIKRAKKSWYHYNLLKNLGLEPDNDSREGANTGIGMGDR